MPRQDPSVWISMVFNTAPESGSNGAVPAHRQRFRPGQGQRAFLRMEQAGLSAKDLEPMIGRSNRVYEVLNRKRGLTLKMIWSLHKGLGIPAASLIQPIIKA